MPRSFDPKNDNEMQMQNQVPERVSMLFHAPASATRISFTYVLSRKVISDLDHCDDAILMRVC